MKTTTSFIGGEISLALTIGKGADGQREIQCQTEAIAVFSNNPYRKDYHIITLILTEFKDGQGRTIGDLLAEQGEDVFKILDQPVEL
jgi:hypothetical protein